MQFIVYQLHLSKAIFKNGTVKVIVQTNLAFGFKINASGQVYVFICL